ncbi:MAG: hypothetical protein V1913_18875, partial [Fibrobacterota bacterium]
HCVCGNSNEAEKRRVMVVIFMLEKIDSVYSLNQAKAEQPPLRSKPFLRIRVELLERLFCAQYSLGVKGDTGSLKTQKRK